MKTLLDGNMTKRDLKKYSFELKTFARYINQIAQLENDSNEYQIGVTDNPAVKMAYNPDNRTFIINPEKFKHDKELILSTAIMRYSVVSQIDLTILLHDVFNGLFDKTFRQ